MGADGGLECSDFITTAARGADLVGLRFPPFAGAHD
jgi:hypothetical protein